MSRALTFLFIGFLAYIPHTSVQQHETSVDDTPKLLPAKEPLNLEPFETILHELIQRQYRYEIVYYKLALKNVLARLFHEQSEQKYVFT